MTCNLQEQSRFFAETFCGNPVDSATINVFMNRDTLLRSHRFFNHYFFQTLLLTGLSFTACPAWSTPIERLSHSAIDLMEQRPALENSFVIKTTRSDIGSHESGARSQASGVKSQESGVSVVDLTSNARIQTISSYQEPTLTPDATPNTQPSIFKREIQARQGSNRTSRRIAQNTPGLKPDTPSPASSLDLDPKLIESSPVLQRWLKRVPNVLADIKRDPSFRTRLRLGYTQFPSSKDASGLYVGLEDVFVGRSGLTLNADYQTAFNQRVAWGVNARYYVRPLGSVINVAPVLGYRHLETTRYSTEGVQVGLRLLLVLSRTGAADLAIMQSWVTPRGENEVGLTTLSFGYALTHSLRLSTDLEKQNSRFRSDSRVGIHLEWMF